ncbi:crooked neck-like protein 1-like [Trifolium medium]|uniref:Crooked neck-like protein 1-like n=1 Tax=Trifolium medium TaxID=97028 RepID=A0A392P5D2_9FABA|nr:crooked neck-like protein 1-like [Trifolium medium]
MPKKLKKRRQVSTEEDGSSRIEEFIDYLFPEETQTTNLKILEAAYKWKKQKFLVRLAKKFGSISWVGYVPEPAAAAACKDL